MDWIEIIVLFVARLALTILFGLLFAFLIKWLWNWIVPDLFGLPLITYWQTVGLSIMIKLMFCNIKIDHNKS